MVSKIEGEGKKKRKIERESGRESKLWYNKEKKLTSLRYQRVGEPLLFSCSTTKYQFPEWPAKRSDVRTSNWKKEMKGKKGAEWEPDSEKGSSLKIAA
jgi:hypothetical protein